MITYKIALKVGVITITLSVILFLLNIILDKAHIAGDGLASTYGLELSPYFMLLLAALAFIASIVLKIAPPYQNPTKTPRKAPGNLTVIGSTLVIIFLLLLMFPLLFYFYFFMFLVGH